MALTEEQQELIRKNRDRALAIQREKKRQRDQESSSSAAVAAAHDDNTLGASPEKRSRNDDDDNGDHHSREELKDLNPSCKESLRERHKDDPSTSANDDDKEPLEAFEEGASEFVTRQDAMKLYCLPAGTLDVCQFVERPNPRNSSWKPMRLYHRKEIRKRAYRRFGGLQGLVQERQQRQDKRLSNDMEKAKLLFR